MSAGAYTGGKAALGGPGAHRLHRSDVAVRGLRRRGTEGPPPHERRAVRRLLDLAGMTRVADVMRTDVVTIPSSATLVDAHRLFERLHLRHLAVVGERGELVGMISERDVRGATAERVADVIHGDVIVATTDDALPHVARLLAEHAIGAVPVVDARGRTVGILSYVDALRAMANELGPAGEIVEDGIEVIELPPDVPLPPRTRPGNHGGAPIGYLDPREVPSHRR